MCNASNYPRCASRGGKDCIGFRLGVDFNILALKLGQFRFKNRRLPGSKQCVKRPVFNRVERPNFDLAVDNQAQRDRLYAPGGEPSANLVPKQGRNLVADQAVQHAARLLRVHQVCVDFARMFERGLDRLRCDFVEHHAEDVLAGDDGFAPGNCFLDWLLGFLFALLAGFVRLFLLLFLPLFGEFQFRSAQHVGQVRADGFPLAVRVARQVDSVGRRGGLLQSLDDGGLGWADFIRRLEAVLDVDAQYLLGQVHDVPVRCLDRVVAAEIFIDRLGLRRRFDDDE